MGKGNSATPYFVVYGSILTAIIVTLGSLGLIK